MSFFKSLGKELDKAGKSISKEMGKVSESINKELDVHASGTMLSMFGTNNVVQLIPRSTGGAMQIVTANTGQLTVDALGAVGPQAYNANWTAINEGRNQVRLHNNNNYIAIINGGLCVIPMSPGQPLGPETKFQLTQTGTFVHLQSMKEPLCHVAFMKSGQIKMGATNIKNEESQFGVKLISGTAVVSEMDKTSASIGRTFSEYSSGTVVNQFCTNNVVQLVSRSSNGSLQIVTSPSGQLAVDGLGAIGPQVYNAVWTVINEGRNQVRLSNNNNFIAIENGQTVVKHVPAGQVHSPETKFQLSQKGNYVCLESLKDPGHHIGVLPNGQLKAALATGKEEHAQFAVTITYTPYVQPVAAEATKVKAPK